ncbi:MAG TPA: AAA family ATPase [Symbiobacteriaceae bacterium]|nr:AAA family ATPase [Symbiobacteriaceae bacterium]
MRIDELILTAFGRFQGEGLSFGPGLNVVYGANEAGKSTLQKFMLGMLYGFKKPGGRREYTADAERYRPWTGVDYRGSLVYTLDSGRSFRVERLFEPGREMARVFDAATGADLTTTFPLDRRKELLFAEAHLGLNEEAFRSTAWVGQLAVGQLEAGRELVARVANLQDSGREDLSVRQALAYLEEQAREIGSERAATKPYGRVLKALAARRAELERAEAAREEIRGWETAQTELKAALEELEAELDRARRAEAEDRQERMAAARRRIRELTATAEALEADAEVPLDGLARLRQMEHEGDEAAASAAAWSARGAALEAEALRFEGPSGMRQHGAAAVRAQEAADAASRGLAARLAGLPAPSVSARLWWVFGALALLAGGGVGYFVSPAAGAAAGVALALPAGLLWLRHQRDAGVRAEAAALTAGVEAARAEFRRLAALAFPGDPEGFPQAYAAWRDGQEQAASLRRQADDALRRAEAEGARARRAAAATAALLAESGVESAADYAAACARREAREKALAEARSLEAALGALLGGEAPEALESPAIRQLESRKAELSVRAGELGARIETALRDAGDPAELRQELEALTEEKAGYDAELAALELARSTIEQVSGELHREFAPRLNRVFGSAAAGVTGGQYRSVQVDQQGAIRVQTADNRTVELSQLSGGTVDQLYLGLRLALLDLVTAGQERLPLLLDDPFVQYDDRRAAAALSYLAGEARQRQVVLLTCHGREVELARRSGAPVHLVALSDVSPEA